MSQTKEIAQAAADTFNSIVGVRGYRWDPQSGGMSGPSVVVFLPAMTRRELDSGESELLSCDRIYKFPISLYVDHGKPQSTQDRVADLVDELIAVIDANPTLGINSLTYRVEDAVLSDLEPQLYESQKGTPVIWEYRGTLSVKCFFLADI